MLAAQVIDQAGTFRVGDVEQPAPGPADVLVKVEAAGLAPGAFNLLYMGNVPNLPTILGHEIAGTVAQVGDSVAPDLVGRRVRVHPLLSCGTCDYCTTDREMMCAENSMIGHAVFGPAARPRYDRYHNGGLAEYVVVPAANIDIIPDAMGFEIAAKVHDFANSIRALKLAALEPASTIIVTAATGAMGTSTMALAREFGVARIIAVGRDSKRLAEVTSIDPDRIQTVTFADDDTPQTLAGRLRAIEPQGAHAAIDYFPTGTGTSAIFGGLRLGARLVHMGVNPQPLIIPPAAFSINCISLVGTRNGTRKDAHDAIRLLSQDLTRYESLITHRFTLDDVDRARDQLKNRTESMWMSVVRPTANQIIS